MSTPRKVSSNSGAGAFFDFGCVRGSVAGPLPLALSAEGLLRLVPLFVSAFGLSQLSETVRDSGADEIEHSPIVSLSLPEWERVVLQLLTSLQSVWEWPQKALLSFAREMMRGARVAPPRLEVGMRSQ